MAYTGWFILTILKNDGVRQWVSDDIPYMKWEIIHSCLKQLTSEMAYNTDQSWSIYCSKGLDSRDSQAGSARLSCRKAIRVILDSDSDSGASGGIWHLVVESMDWLYTTNHICICIPYIYICIPYIYIYTQIIYTFYGICMYIYIYGIPYEPFMGIKLTKSKLGLGDSKWELMNWGDSKHQIDEIPINNNPINGRTGLRMFKQQTAIHSYLMDCVLQKSTGNWLLFASNMVVP